MQNHNPNRKRSVKQDWGPSDGGALNKGLAYHKNGGMKPEDIGATNSGKNQTPDGNKKTGNFC